MAIAITCPGCHKRFQVSDKFAGQKGPCPNCKTIISIPKKEEEAVIHEPEQFGQKGKLGAAVFKPIGRTETPFSPAIAALVAGVAIMVFALAFVVRSNFGEQGPPLVLLVIGSIALGPPIALGGYSILRDADLEPHRGKSLWLRVGICGLVYALIWGIVAFVIRGYLLELDWNVPFETFQLVMVLPAMVALGAFAAHASLDLEISNAAVHYGFYLLITVLLRLTMGMTVV